MIFLRWWKDGLCILGMSSFKDGSPGHPSINAKIWLIRFVVKSLQKNNKNLSVRRKSQLIQNKACQSGLMEVCSNGTLFGHVHCSVHILVNCTPTKIICQFLEQLVICCFVHFLVFILLGFLCLNISWFCENKYIITLILFHLINIRNTPGTAGGPGGCDRTLAVKSLKNQRRRRKKRENTPGTAGGPGGCDRTLAIKSRKKA